MKILGLYNNECAMELFDWIKDEGHEVVLVTEPLDDEWLRGQNFELAVSYTYRHIVKESSIYILKGNIVNLHNSFLPWNRGADPNMWSVIEDTPKGVTLHYMDANLDKGYIIAQKLVESTGDDTLKSSYYRLDAAAKQLFKESFRYYDCWEEMKKKPLGKGSYHSVKDGEKFKIMDNIYDVLLNEFKKIAISGGERPKTQKSILNVGIQSDNATAKMNEVVYENNSADENTQKVETTEQQKIVFGQSGGGYREIRKFEVYVA